MVRKHSLRRSRGSVGGSAWISYSDMMAALLLVFVLILCYSLYQYFLMLETKTAELDRQSILLSEQQSTLDSQQTILIAQNLILSAQTIELEESKALVEGQVILLGEQEAALTQAEETLAVRESELIIARAELLAKQEELDQATILLGKQQSALENQTLKLESLVGIRTKIIKELTQALADANMKASVDAKTGDIVLESAVFFDSGKDSIKQEGQEFLEKFIPVYLGVLLRPEYEEYMAEIIIEGHTDTDSSYLFNLKLSQQRALGVAQFCLESDSISLDQKLLLQKIMTAKGRSFADPIYKADGTVDKEASRRVEFKFRLKDSEMIDEMRDILGRYATDGVAGQ